METVVAGSLRSNLYDLYEAQNWGFATEKVGAPYQTPLSDKCALCAHWLLPASAAPTVPHWFLQSISVVLRSACAAWIAHSQRAAQLGQVLELLLNLHLCELQEAQQALQGR